MRTLLTVLIALFLLMLISPPVFAQNIVKYPPSVVTIGVGTVEFRDRITNQLLHTCATTPVTLATWGSSSCSFNNSFFTISLLHNTHLLIGAKAKDGIKISTVLPGVIAYETGSDVTDPDGACYSGYGSSIPGSEPPAEAFIGFFPGNLGATDRLFSIAGTFTVRNTQGTIDLTHTFGQQFDIDQNTTTWPNFHSFYTQNQSVAFYDGPPPQNPLCVLGLSPRIQLGDPDVAGDSFFTMMLALEGLQGPCPNCE